MKPTLLLILFSFFAALTYSQTIVENPKIGMSSGSFLKIKKIELRDTVTVLWFHTNYQPGVWIRVPKETYIQPFGSKEKLFIVATKGIPLNEEYTVPASGEVEYCLFFPKMDAAVSRFDYGEGNTDPGSWFIYDIQLKPELFKPLVPEKIVGNWFRSDNAQWEISLFDSVAVYKSQVWKYGKYAEKDGEGMINLKKGSKVLTIYTKSINDSTCLFGEKRSKMKTYAHHVDESQIPADKEPYQLPVFKMDTVTYSGYIKGFSPRFPQRTGMVYVNDVLTGEQASYPLSIADNGSFTVKFVHTNPQGVFVQLPNSFQTVFVEPGKTTFQLFDNGNQTNPVLYMGDCARTNSDLLKLKNINSFDHNQMVEKVLDFSPVQYKDFCKDLQQKDLEAVASFVQTHTLSAKAEQVKKLEIEYRYASSIFEYGWNVESAWRKKNNIPNTQREIPYKSAKPDSSYFSFLTNELVNNPLGVLSSDYSTFINRLMYLEILKSNARSSFSLPEIAAEMEKAGYQLTPVQEELSIQMKGIITPELIKVDEEFEHKYGPQFKDFHQKYDDRLKGLYSAKKGSIVTVEMIKEFLIAQQIELTADETAMLLAQKEFNENPLVQKRSMFYAQFNQGISQFFKDNRPFINELFKKRSSSNRKENIQHVLGVKPGFATDIMTSQDICQTIVAEKTPCTDEKLKESQKEITTPFIASYMELKNKEAKAKIEANKKQRVAIVNEVPKYTSDNVFEAIMEKYKGKVVYVDFWATCCAPCRSGIEQIKPLKDEMANENVAFVYITDQSSPKTTYDNMIPNIKGEHYRLSNDEWHVLSSMFKITGIPHCVLVGKDGKVINPELGHLGNSALKTMLMKYIVE